ncbi:MAG: magnesium/cobalt transporter CorA [Actinobacteria bacterium]|nr:magnesium/cobalt transporter CorA [Actinomycetota bacterium]
MRSILFSGEKAEVFDGPVPGGDGGAPGIPAEGYVWIDAGPDEVPSLARGFNLHSLAVEDCVDTDQRPKIDEYDEHGFIVTNVAQEWSGKKFRADELDIFFADRFLITSHRSPIPALDRIFEETRESRSGLGQILYKLLDAAVDSFFPVLDEIGDKLEAHDEQILTRPVRRAMDELFFLKRQLLRVRKVLLPQRDMLHSVTVRDLPLVDEKLKRYMIDVFGHSMRLAELTETYRDLVSSTVEAYLSVIANRTNEAMRVLAAVSTVFLPLSLIAGIYGMNFENLPGTQSRYGYLAVLLVMAVIFGFMFRFFKRKDWL